MTLALRVGPTEFYLGEFDATQLRAMTEGSTGGLSARSRAARCVLKPDVIRATWKRVDDPSVLSAKPTVEIELVG